MSAPTDKPLSMSKSRRSLDPLEGVAIILAYRRGVSMEDIAAELGCNRGNIYSKLGAWALQFAEIKDAD